MQASEGSFLCIQASLQLALITLVFILLIWFLSPALPLTSSWLLCQPGCVPSLPPALPSWSHSVFLSRCLSLSLSEFSCYLSLYHTLILRVPPNQTGVVYPAAICKTSLLLHVTPSENEKEKAERLGKQRRNETENIEASRLGYQHPNLQERASQVPNSP